MIRRWYDERVQTWAVDAESEDQAIQVARDGGGSAGTDDWYAEVDRLNPIAATDA